MASAMVVAQRLGELAAIDFGIQFVGWGFSSYLRTERFYDVTGSLTYWAMILRARAFAQETSAGEAAGDAGLSLRKQICSLCVIFWTTRLGLFLAQRAWKHGDSRFDKVKNKPKLFLLYWMVQGVWCFWTALPVYMLLAQPEKDSLPLNFVDGLSWGGWLVGFILEAVADFQKSSWRAAGNKSFVQSGVWKYSQHPNYFGEMMLWSSLSLSAIRGIGDSNVQRLAAISSPLFVCYLLRFVSGVPLLQKASMQKYGSDPAYLDYVARTNLLLPWPTRR